MTKAKLKRSDINFFRYVHRCDLLKQYRDDINRSYEVIEDEPFVITVHGEQEDYQLAFNEEGKVWEIEK